MPEDERTDRTGGYYCSKKEQADRQPQRKTDCSDDHGYDPHQDRVLSVFKSANILFLLKVNSDPQFVA